MEQTNTLPVDCDILLLVPDTAEIIVADTSRTISDVERASYRSFCFTTPVTIEFNSNPPSSVSLETMESLFIHPSMVDFKITSGTDSTLFFGA